MASKQITCDLAIIGAGAGGLSVAAVAAQLGQSVVLIESGEMGGDCLNVGCVPSKSLLAAAKAQWQAMHSQQFGVTVQEAQLSFEIAMLHVRKVIAALAPHDSQQRFESLGCRVIRAAGKFIDKKTIQAGEHTIRFKKVVIATGSSVFIPPIAGLDQINYLTNETIFNLKQQPKKLLVIGGGPIGMEMAQAFAMLGSEVVVIDAARVLPMLTENQAEVIKQSMCAMGVHFFENSGIVEVKQEGDQIGIKLKQGDKDLLVTGSDLLVATGRRANVDGLDLQQADIEFTAKGIQVTSRLRTSNKNIYAIGDVVGGLQFTHMASYQAGIVIKNMLFKMPAKMNAQAFPYVIYMQPEVAHAGLSIHEAHKKSVSHQLIHVDFSALDRAQAEGHPEGFIEVLLDKKGKVLGATIIGIHAGELIVPWVMVIQQKLSIQVMADLIVPYPTLGDIHKKVASAYYAPKLFSSSTKRLVKWLSVIF